MALTTRMDVTLAGMMAMMMVKMMVMMKMTMMKMMIMKDENEVDDDKLMMTGYSLTTWPGWA